MYERPTAPRSIGGVLDDAIKLYRDTFRYWWLPGLILAVCTAAVGMFIVAAIGTTGVRPDPQQMFRLMANPAVWMGYIVVVVSSIYLFLVMLANLNAVATGKEISLGDGFAAGLRALPKAIAASILYGFSVALGFVLLILPGFYVLYRLQFWGVALISEDVGAGGSLAQSWRLVAGNWWRTATIFTVVYVVLIVLTLLVQFLLALTLRLGHADPTATLVVTEIGEGITRLLTAGLFPAALVVTYQDLRLRHQGGDLEARVSGLRPA